MHLPLVPTWSISILAFSGGILCLVSLYRFNHAISTSLKFGLALLAPALIGFGWLYFYFTSFVTDTILRMSSVRMGLFYLFAVIIIWQINLNVKRGK